MKNIFLLIFTLSIVSLNAQSDAVDSVTTEPAKLSAKEIKNVLDNIAEKQYFNDDEADKPVYNLLWKISGNGLSKPSYLFGTMHVRNYRAFNFPQQLYEAIEEVDGFSMEFHPDSMISGALSHCYFSDDYYTKDQIITHEENETPGLKFKKPVSLEGMLNRDGHSSNGKKTFVDAYLYDMARMRGKNVHGLENMADYYKIESKNMGLSKDFLLQYHNKYSLLSIYNEGNIDSIYQYMTRVFDTTSRRFQTLLIDRNYSMANKIDELIKNEAIFNTMGSAHLGGSEGVVALLKKKGYTLKAVEPTFDFEEQETDDVIPDGFVFENKRDGYKVTYPGKPFVPNLDSIQFAKYIYGDIGRNSFYESYTIDFSDYDSLEFKDIERKIVISLLKSGYDYEIDTNYLVDHPTGLYSREFIVKSGSYYNDDYYRLRVLQDDKKAFVLLYRSLKEDLNFEEANRFFDSFDVIPITEKSIKKSYSHVDPVGAFKVTFPETYAKYSIEDDFYEDKSTNVRKYFTGFSNELTSRKYLVRYQDAPPGQYISNDSLIYGEIVDELKREYGRLKSVEKIEKSGVEGLRTVFKKRRKSSTAEIFTRGSRSYIALVVREKDQKKVDDFIGSFDLLPFEKSNYTTYTDPNNVFSAKFADQKVIVDTVHDNLPASIKELVRYGQTDSLTGQTNAVLQYEISPYAQVENVDSLLNEFFSDQDYEVVKDTKVSTGSLYKKTASTSDRVITEFEFKQVGNFVIGKLSSYPNDKTALENKNAFFNSVQIKNHDANFDFKTSKKNVVLSDLSSGDSLKIVDALKFFDYYSYSNSDLPKIYKIIKSRFHDDFDSTQNIKVQIIQKLKEFDDPSVGEFLVNVLKDTLCINCQPALLDVIIRSNLKDKYDVMFQTLKSPDFRVTDPRTLDQALSVFRESIGLTAEYMDQLWSLNKDNNYEYNLTHILSDHILNGDTKKLKLSSHTQDIHILAQKYLSSHDTILEQDPVKLATARNVTVLLGELSSEESMNYLKGLESSKLLELRKYAMHALLKRNQEVNRDFLDSLMMKDKHRLSTYKLFKDLSKEDLFSEEQITPKLLAQSQMFEYFENYSADYGFETPDTILYVGEGLYNHEGNKYTYYVFRSYKASSEYYYGRYIEKGRLPKSGGKIGVSGLHPEKGFDFNAKYTYSDYSRYDRYTFFRDAKRMIHKSVNKNKY